MRLLGIFGETVTHACSHAENKVILSREANWEHIPPFLPPHTLRCCLMILALSTALPGPKDIKVSMIQGPHGLGLHCILNTPSALWPRLWYPAGPEVGPWCPCQCGSGWGRKLWTTPKTTPEDPEVAFPLRLELKILWLLWHSHSPWVILMEEGRKQLFLSAFPSSLLVTHSSSFSLSACFFSLFCDTAPLPTFFFLKWKSFQNKQEINHKPTSPLAGKKHPWQRKQQLNKCHLKWQ